MTQFAILPCQQALLAVAKPVALITGLHAHPGSSPGSVRKFGVTGSTPDAILEMDTMSKNETGSFEAIKIAVTRNALGKHYTAGVRTDCLNLDSRRKEYGQAQDKSYH